LSIHLAPPPQNVIVEASLSRHPFLPFIVEEKRSFDAPLWNLSTCLLSAYFEVSAFVMMTTSTEHVLWCRVAMGLVFVVELLLTCVDMCGHGWVM
jgi:hypothetical protein